MQNLEPGTQNLESVPAGRGSGRHARDTEFQVQGSRFQIPDSRSDDWIDKSRLHAECCQLSSVKSAQIVDEDSYRSSWQTPLPPDSEFSTTPSNPEPPFIARSLHVIPFHCGEATRWLAAVHISPRPKAVAHLLIYSMSIQPRLTFKIPAMSRRCLSEPPH